ncbi:YihY/virulence factor BrkB family protein [Paraburkholderia aromaticivorans]|uniref:YihY/virulence factor BrkB family protein n=1 Tax=Paraburkholderia aromaticivorans TaxID=2026199 RepID=UPI001F0D2110|nr:YihY/virulence factor BrkB family protein [Paraburkholderia aromaticivorans]
MSTARTAISKFSDDRCSMMGASIGFFSAFSLAPTLLIVLAVAGWFFGPDAAKGRLFDQVKGVLGNDAASAMQTLVEHAHRASGGGIASAISVALVAVGASATFSSLNTALDVVFAAESPKGIAGLALLLRARLISFGMVMGLGFLLVVSLVLDTAIQFAGRMVFGDSKLVVLAAIGESVFGLVILAIGFAALIKLLPDAKVRFRHALIGGVTASVLFTAGRHLFGFYLAHAGTANSFGAAGSLAVLMMWLYFSAVVFLFGSEIAASIRKASEATGEKPATDPRPSIATRR